jgi:hypothetical protein
MSTATRTVSATKAPDPGARAELSNTMPDNKIAVAVIRKTLSSLLKLNT